jgi:hypothetical protein
MRLGSIGFTHFVMPGLDPGIHSVTVTSVDCRYGMDCRVKPGNDDKKRFVR